jgi:hypothetical protein
MLSVRPQCQTRMQIAVELCRAAKRASLGVLEACRGAAALWAFWKPVRRLRKPPFCFCGALLRGFRARAPRFALLSLGAVLGRSVGETAPGA